MPRRAWPAPRMPLSARRCSAVAALLLGLGLAGAPGCSPTKSAAGGADAPAPDARPDAALFDLPRPASGDAEGPGDASPTADAPAPGPCELPTAPPPAEPPPAEPFRPLAHFTPAAGWLNDPNGLVFSQGEYHLCFQNYPAAPIWGPMHWGHAVSPDLVRWQPLAEALAPDPTLGMPFSGSALVATGAARGLCTPPPDGADDCLVALFTHHGGTVGGEKQSLALSRDRGRTWALYAGNPVIPNPGSADFRDPKVFWHAPTAQYVAILAAHDRAPLYGSADLVTWTPLGTVGPFADAPAVWECPELFPLADPTAPGGERWVFKVDLNRGPAPTAEPSALYALGRFDGTTFVPAGGPLRRVDHGPDFYAAQSWSNEPLGRRIWIGWLAHWLYALRTPTGAWRGTMSLPRQVTLGLAAAEPVLCQQPAPEVAALRTGLVAAHCGLELPGAPEANLALARGRAFDIALTLGAGAAATVALGLFVGPTEETLVGVDLARGVLFLDRTRSGNVAFAPGFAGRYEAPLFPAAPGEPLDLRVLVDVSTVEVFAQGGRVVLSGLVFPDPMSDGLELRVTGGPAQIEHLAVHRLAAPPAGAE